MYKVNCRVKANEKIQIEFDSLEDFFKYDKKRKSQNIEKEISGHIKSIDEYVLFFDEYGDGLFEWVLVNSKRFLNRLEPMGWHMDQLAKIEAELQAK